MTYDNELVKKVSIYLQDYLEQSGKEYITINEATELLHEKGILLDNVVANIGAKLKILLGKGRDCKILLVEGTYQEFKSSNWKIYNKNKYPEKLKQHMIKKKVKYIQ